MKILVLALSAALLSNSHDITSLPDWGPYSKQYAGISHIADTGSGARVDFFVAPGFYRRSGVEVPSRLQESSCYPWEISPDMKHITYRQMLEWKDRVFVDATYHLLDRSRVLLELKCVNNTDRSQSLTLHMISNAAFEDRNGPVPELIRSGNGYIARYDGISAYYGAGWNFPVSDLCIYVSDNLETVLKSKTDKAVDHSRKPRKGTCYLSAFQRPVNLRAHSDTTVWNMLCTGTREEVEKALRTFHDDEASVISQVEPYRSSADGVLPGAGDYLPADRILRATVLSNVVYPIRAEGQNIRHFTPGLKWNSLYTWDSGVIALALGRINPCYAFETVRAYTTDPGSDLPFLHHGTPLPTHFFAFEELCSASLDMEKIEFLYPRLKHFLGYMLDWDGRSGNAMKSGLLNTWHMFYNSGGWDDYPPQWYLKSHKELYGRVAPIVSSAYYIRAAKILRMVAERLGKKEDVRRLDASIKTLSSAVLDNAWDEQTGYFGYVTHDSSLKPDGLFRYHDGTNWNMGLDGITPLVAGIGNKNQRDRMLDNLFSEKHLWTEYGISTVDRSAPYYDRTGYWNGCIWMPHQYFLWKAMLDLGLPEKAGLIAMTGLKTWSDEVNESYQCYEHFFVENGRGGGWHNFSGLSSAVVNWFAAYYRKGTLSTGFDAMVLRQDWNGDCSRLEAELVFDKYSEGNLASVLLCMAPSSKYRACVNGKPVPTYSPGEGVVYVPVTSSRKTARIVVEAL